MSGESQLEGFLSLYDKNTVRAENLGIFDTGSKFGNVGLLSERGAVILKFS